MQSWKRKIRRLSKQAKVYWEKELKSRRRWLKNHSPDVRDMRDMRKKFARSYWFLFAVVLTVGFSTLEWAASRRATEWEAISNFSMPRSYVEAVLAQKPWAFFHPSWNVENEWSLIPVQNETPKFPKPSANLAPYIDDPHGKVEREFKVTPGIKARVQFWMDIYGKYSSRIKVIHDRNDPGVVYGFIDLRPLYRALTNQAADTRGANIERAVIAELKQKLAGSIGISNGYVDVDEKGKILTFLSQVGSLSTNDTERLIDGVRSQTGQQEHFLRAIYRSAELLPHIESVFKRNGLPGSLARIPFVESSFNAAAKSDVGAVGIWQFMPDTARQMIHAEDQAAWADPIRQTRSAAKLIRIYKNVLSDWSLTVTAYNSGVGRVRRLSQTYRARNVEKLLKLSVDEGLGFAGQNFWAEVLAANLVERYKEKIFERILPPNELELVFKGVRPIPKDFGDF